MKIENWLEEHELSELKNIGLVALILHWLPSKKAQDLNILLWNIKWAKNASDKFQEWYEESKNNDIFGMRCKIEWYAEDCKAWDFIDLYNRNKYFWLPHIKK